MMRMMKQGSMGRDFMVRMVSSEPVISKCCYLINFLISLFNNLDKSFCSEPRSLPLFIWARTSICLRGRAVAGFTLRRIRNRKTNFQKTNVSDEVRVNFFLVSFPDAVVSISRPDFVLFTGIIRILSRLISLTLITACYGHAFLKLVVKVLWHRFSHLPTIFGNRHC